MNLLLPWIPLRLSLAKKKTFLQLCDLFKRNKQYIFNRKITQSCCLCKICENSPFQANGMNKKLFSECRNVAFFLTIHEPVAKFSCSNKENYVIGECKKCSSKKCSSHNWHTRSTSVSDVDGEDENVSKDSMSHYK